MIKNEIKMLSDKEHVIKRPGMYVGSTSSEEYERFQFGKYVKLKYVPAIVKLIEEIRDNSIDEAVRTNFEFANKISVTIDTEKNLVTVEDNGRGIPQAMITTPEGDSIPGPVAAWTKTKAGGNFGEDSERKTSGMNGVGSSLTNIFSTSFIGTTCDGTNTLVVKCTNNIDTIDWKSKAGGKHGTKVEFIPDFSHFECNSIDDVIVSIIEDQMQTLAVVYPEIQFKFNGSRIIGNFKKYAKQYDENALCYESDKVQLAIGTSEDGFRHLSYVNAIHTKVGGSHIDYVMDELSNELIPLIKRKFKIDVNKARIKECVTLLLFVKDMSNLRFDSQTKERLTSPWGEIKSHIDLDFKKIVKQFMNTESILMPIIEAVLARKLAAEKAAETKANKAAQKAKVSKHIKANKYGNSELETTLFLTEGDCFDENTEIFTLDGNIRAKDIQVGDTVMTAKHNFKQVVSKTIRLKPGIKINGKIYSNEHKLYAYDTVLDTVEYIRVDSLVKGRHKLIKNRLVELGGPINRSRQIVELTESSMVVKSVIGTTHRINSSPTHEMIVMDTDGLKLKQFKDITLNDVIIV